MASSISRGASSVVDGAVGVVKWTADQATKPVSWMADAVGATAEAVGATAEAVVLSPTAAVRTSAKQVDEEVIGNIQLLTKAMTDLRSDVCRDVKSLREDMAAMSARLDIIEHNRHREHKAAKGPAPRARPEVSSTNNLADLSEEIKLADLAEEIKLTDLSEEEIDHELEESIWEAPLVLTLQEHGCLGNLFMLILVVFNVILQSTLIQVIRTKLLEDVVDDETIQDYTRWRRGAGHDMKFMDSQQQSLASQVRSQGTQTSAHSASSCAQCPCQPTLHTDRLCGIACTPNRCAPAR